jgi:hypothetical protein
LRAATVASKHGMGEFDRSIRIGMHKDKAGLESAKAHFDRALELAKMINDSFDYLTGKDC